MTTLSPQEKLEALKKRIIEANPEIDKPTFIKELQGEFGGLGFHGRPIRLSDVLIAAKALPDYGHHLAEIVSFWHLPHDSLDDQSEETISFLHALLCGSERT